MHSDNPCYKSVEKLLLNLTLQDDQSPTTLHRPQTPAWPLSARIETSFSVDNAEPRTRIYHQGDDRASTASSDKHSGRNRYSSIWSVDSKAQMSNLNQRCLSMTDVTQVEYPENELREQKRVDSWLSINSQDMPQQTPDMLNYGFTVAVATTPVNKKGSYTRHCNPPDHDYCHSEWTQSRYNYQLPDTCSSASPPPYKAPPSYAASTSRTHLNRTISESTSSGSYSTACSHMSPEDAYVRNSCTHVDRLDGARPLRSVSSMSQDDRQIRRSNTTIQRLNGNGGRPLRSLSMIHDDKQTRRSCTNIGRLDGARQLRSLSMSRDDQPTRNSCTNIGRLDGPRPFRSLSMNQEDRQTKSSCTNVEGVDSLKPLRSLYMTKNTEMTQSRASLTESYRMAVHNNDTAVTPIDKSLFSTLRRTESSPSKAFKNVFSLILIKKYCTSENACL